MMASPSNEKGDPMMDSLPSREKLMEKYKQALTIAQKAKNARDEAMKDNKTILVENENLKGKIKSLEKQYNTAEEMLAALTDQKLKLAMEIDDLKKQKALFIQELKSKENAEIEVESFKRQYNRLLKENEDLIKKFGPTESESVQLRKELVELKKDNENLKQMYNNIKSEKEDLDKSFKDTLERLCSMEQTQKNLSNSLSKKFKKNIGDLNDWSDIIASLDDKLPKDDLLEEIENLKAEKEKCNHTIVLLTKEKENFEQEVNDLNILVKNIREELDVANSDRDKMMCNLEKVGLETKQLIENSEKLTDEIEILKQEKCRQDQALAYLQSEKENLSRIIKENEDEISHMSLEFSKCQRLNDELSHKIEEFENSSCCSELRDTSNELSRSTECIEEKSESGTITLQTEEKQLKKEASVNSELNQLQEELQVFSGEIVKYKQIADDNEKKYFDAIRELSEKENEIIGKDIIIEEFKGKLSLFEEQQDTLNSNLSQCKVQLLSALEDLSHAEEIKNTIKLESEAKEQRLTIILDDIKEKDAIILEKLKEVQILQQETLEKSNIIKELESNLHRYQEDNIIKENYIKSQIEETNNLKNSLTQITQESTVKIKNYEQKILKLNKELNDITQLNDVLTSDNSHLNKQLKDLLNEQATENNSLVQKLTCLQDSLQSQVAEKQTNISSLEQEISNLKAEVISLNEKIKLISAENEALKSDNHSLKLSSSEESDVLSRSNAELQEKLYNQITESNNKDNILADLKNELIESKDEWEKEKNMLYHENEDLKNSISSSFLKLINLNKKILEDLAKLRKDAGDDMDLSRQEIVLNDLPALSNELNNSHQKLREEIHTFVNVSESLRNENTNVGIELASLRSEIEQLSDLQTRLQEATLSLERQGIIINDLENEKNILSKQESEFRGNFTQLEKDYSALKVSFADLNKESELLIANKHSELEQKDLLIKDLRQNLEDIKSKHNELLETHVRSEDIESAVCKLREANRLLEEENLSVKEQISHRDHLVSERSSLIEEIKTLKGKIEELSIINDSLNQNLSVFRDNFESMRESHSTEKKDLNEQIKKFQEKLNNCNELLEFKTLELKENNRIWAGRFSSLKIALIGLNKSRKEIQNHFECLETTFISFMKQIKEPLQEKVNMVVQESLSSAKHELISEMHQMNQALKERGETISKLEFALSESQNNIKHLSSSNENFSKELEQARSELKELESRIKEKDLYIKQLEDEIDQLKESHDNTADTDVLSTSTISRTEEHSRLKDVEDSFEDRYAKLKLLAVKMKKRIGELTQTLEGERTKMATERSELQEKISGMSMAVKNAQKLQELFDQSLDERDELKKKNKALENSLEEIKISEENLKIKITTLESNNQSIPVMKKHIDSLNAVIKENKSELQRLQMENKAENIKYEELKKANLKLETKIQELSSSLELAKQQGKNSNVLELEIKNYEKIISELSSQVNAEKTLVKSLQTENEAATNVKVGLEEQIAILEKQIRVEEERNQHTNEQLNSTRNKLDEASSQIESLHKEIEELQKQLTNEKHKSEALTLEMSQVTSEFSKKDISMSSRIASLQEQIRSLETSLGATKQELATSKHENEHLNEEYESYKLRAQTILAKKKGNFVTHGEKEAKEEVERLKKECKLLEEKIEAYITEIDTANTRLSSLALEKARSDKKYEEMKLALQQKIVDYDLLNTEYHNYKISNESAIEKLKEEMAQKKSEYQSEISNHRKIIEELNSEFRLKEEAVGVSKEKTESWTGGMEVGAQDTIPLPLEREDGEGSESVPSPKTRRRSSIVPLDVLLNNPIYDENKVTILHEQVEKLRRELSSYEVRCRHLSSLLSEAEKDSARNLHQNKILKEEVRRLERSLERQPHVANTEYLKNVVFKFVTLPHGDERTRLVPVLDTLLKLSPDETQKLNFVAKGESQASWSSYLPSWTGL